MEKYNKLVRDKIPAIIREQGDEPTTQILSDREYFLALNAKLQEEVNEYLEDYSIEELADILEVIYAIAKHKGVAVAGLEQVRKAKADVRGGFDDKIKLLTVVRRGNE